MGQSSRLGVVDRINEWGERFPFVQALHGLDERISAWSDARRWRKIDKETGRLIAGYSGDAETKEKLVKFAQARREYSLTRFKDNDERGRFLHDKVEPTRDEILHSKDNKAISVLQDLVIIISPY